MGAESGCVADCGGGTLAVSGDAGGELWDGSVKVKC
jgi:hypothetical protein